MSENTRSSKKRKALSATLAVAMVATMLLTGTLAYFSRATAVNIVKGDLKNVVAHDDFDPKTGNKDVYVENLGTSPVFVRVRLTEDYWDSAQAKNTDPTTMAKRPYAYLSGYEEIKKGSGDGETAVGKAIVGLNSMSNAFHQNYFSLTLADADRPQKVFLSADATDPAQTNHYGTAAADGKYIEKKVAYDPQNDGNLYTEDATNPFIKRTNTSQGVLNVDNWWELRNTEADATLEEKLTNSDEFYYWAGWIEDPNSHWFYWSQPLAGGEATGLLLDQITKQGNIAAEKLQYEYHIHVEFEAVDTTDMDLWTGEKMQEVSGDSWQDSGNIGDIPFYLITQLLDRLKVRVDENLDAQIEQMQALRTELLALPNVTVEGASVQGYSSAAANLLEQALLKAGTFVVGGAEEELVKTALREAQKLQAEYAAELAAGRNPNQPLINLSALASGVDENFAKFLVNSYGADGVLTKEAAKGITVIEYSETDTTPTEEQVKDVSLINAENFPNLTRLKLNNMKSLVLAKDDGGNAIPFGRTLPMSITELVVRNCPGITQMDVSALSSLEEFDIFGMENLSGMGTSGDGKINFGGTDGKSGVNLKLKHLDLRLSGFSSFSANDFPNLEILRINADKMMNVNLRGATKLMNLRLLGHAASEIDLRDCAFSVFAEPGSVYWGKVLKKVTIREDQILQDSPLPREDSVGIVRVVSTNDKETVVRYEKWTKDGKVGIYTDGEVGSGETKLGSLAAGADAFAHAADPATSTPGA